MTMKEAMYLVRVQIQNNEQNKEVLSLLQEAVDLYEEVNDTEVTYTLPEIKDTLGLLDNLCVRYTNVEEEE